MKQFFKILFACLSALVLFSLLIFISFLGAVAGSAKSDKAEVKKNSVLMIDLNESMSEQGSENSFGTFPGDPTSAVMGLKDVLRSLEAAKKDDKIQGVFIKLGASMNGWASLKAVREALKSFKTSKKFVYAFGDIADQKTYYVATAADKIFLNPKGMMEFVGLSINGMFFKGALDKLDIQTEAFHCGKFKGAYEPYALEKFSEPNRYQLGEMLKDLYADFLMGVAEKSGKDTATLSALAYNGVIRFPSDAVKNQLIDGVLFSDSVENMIKSKLGLKEADKISWVTPDDYATSIPEKKSDKKIAILYADGTIYDGEGNEDIYSKTLTKTIRKIAKDDDIKAVVLRINSPGGSALASENIYHELMNLKRKKPIVVSMGNYAASGGYYMACAGDSVFAETNTITGSIGVVGVMFNITNMMKNKLGVTTDQVKTGPFADFPNMTRPMTDGERQWIQNYLDSTYVLFKSRVAEARKLPMDTVENLAQGHVYSGTVAKKLKLVDDIGDIQRALRSAAKLAKMDEYALVDYPEKIDPIEEFISSFSGKKREEAAVRRLLGDEYIIYQQIQKIRSRQNQIQTIMPFVIEIR